MSEKDARNGNKPDPKSNYRNGQTGKEAVNPHVNRFQYKREKFMLERAGNIHQTGSPQRK